MSNVQITYFPWLRVAVQLGQQSWLTRLRLGKSPRPTVCRPLWSGSVSPLDLICRDTERSAERSADRQRHAERHGGGGPTDEAEDVADEVGRVLLRPTGPEPQEALDVGLQPLQLVFRQILEMILQLIHGQQLAV